jgi:hypothetical protein
MATGDRIRDDDFTWPTNLDQLHRNICCGTQTSANKVGWKSPDKKSFKSDIMSGHPVLCRPTSF